MRIDYTPELKNSGSRVIRCKADAAAERTFFHISEAGCLKKEDAELFQPQSSGSFLFAAVISGKGKLTCGEVTQTVTAGQCIYADCRVPHGFQGDKDDAWELLWINFSGSTSEQYYSLLKSRFSGVFRPHSFSRITAALMEIIAVNESYSPDSDVLTSKLIVDVLTLALTAENTEFDSGTSLEHKLSAVHDYIESHFCEELTLEGISSAFYISRYYLARAYKKIYGKTIFQHIISLRLDYGKQLLRSSDRSVEEISQLCGFSDQNYFARQFKKQENLTCIAYRKKWKK